MNKYSKTVQCKLFQDNQVLSNRCQIFRQTELGRMYKAIPFELLSLLLPDRVGGSVGAPAWFSNEGLLGLMFLKSYLGLSDAKLVNRINSDWELQMFCGRQFSDNERIRDLNLPSRTRSYIGNNIDLDKFQNIVINEWKPYLKDQHCGMADATAYESYIKYPTDQKLLWDCCSWVFNTLFSLCNELVIKRPRSKYIEQESKQLAFSKIKKKTHKIRNRRRTSLLYLLNKGLDQLKELISLYATQIDMLVLLRIEAKLCTINTIYKQQKYMHENPGEYSKNRIVSLFKPYLSPIIRGKENKRVEFGAKVHMYQIDGINIIDKLSFDAFNEATLLKGCVARHKENIGEICQLGVDRIYGTNENRKFLTKLGIHTCLPIKGRPSKQEPQVKELRSQIGKQRATVMEGSFGNEKNHYTLRKIKARTQETEIIWILFGVMTANAVKISKRIGT